MTNVYNRHIQLDGTHNVRDLGGYPHRGGGKTAWRAVLRADGLHNMTPASSGELAEIGVRTIIDLRGPHELTVNPNPFAEHATISYHNIPLFDALAPIATQGDASFDMAARYRDAVDRCGLRVSQVLTAIADAVPGAVVFHCTAGKDRTGIIAALLLMAVAVPDNIIVEDYALTESAASVLLMRLRTAAIETGVAADTMDRILASKAGTMQELLRHIEVRYGGIDGYLNYIGLNELTVARLKTRLVA